MSDVVLSTTESVTTVTVVDDVVQVAVTTNPVEVGTSTAGVQGASYEKGDPIYVTVRNATGSTLAKGTIVYTAGAQGNHTLVQKALASGDATSARTLGWVADDILNNADGLVVVEGYLDGIDTDHIAEGSQLYLSGTVAGGFTATKPVAPIHLVYVGVVTKSNPGNGRVLVKVQNGYELSEIHDVLIVNPVNAQVLTYDSATDLWVNATNPADGVTSITAVSPLTGGTITSTGSIGLDQTALSIAQSQVSGLVSDLAGKANLAGGNALTGAQTITGTATGSRVLTLTGASGQTGRLLELQNNSGDALTWIGSAGQIRTSVSIRSISMDSVIGQLAMQSGNALTPTAILRGATSQTANLQEWQNDAGTIQARVTSGGSLVTTQGFAVLGGASISGSIASLLQSASASRIPVAVQGAASQSVDLQQWQNSAGAVLARIKFDGTPTFSYGTFFGTQTLTADGDSVVPLAVRPFSATQTADLVQYRNSSNSTIAAVTAAGFNLTPGLRAVDNTGAFINMQSGTNGVLVSTRAAGNLGLVVRGVASQTADALQVQDVGNFVKAAISASGSLLADRAALGGAVYGTGIYYGKLNVLQEPGGNVAAFQGRDSQSVDLLRLRQGASSTGDFITMQNSSGTNIARVTSAGLVRAADNVIANALVGASGSADNSVTTALVRIQANSTLGGGWLQATRLTSAPGNIAVDSGQVYFRTGTNPNTLKLVVKAGAGAEQTILDNIPT